MLTPGAPVTISYILNDLATNVTVRVFAGRNPVKTFSSDDGGAGTNIGLNTITWDGTWDGGTNDFRGVYRVGITACSPGYSAWTAITDDGTNFAVAVPRGIDVNRNTNSPYYGRVFVGNSYPVGGSPPFDEVGVFKYNPDGSPADEGDFSTGGWPWAGDKYSPWKIAVGPDDRVYVDDFSANGELLSFDEVISTNSLTEVIRSDNYPYPAYAGGAAGPWLSGVSVTSCQTNTYVWMPDAYPQPPGSAGVLRWLLTNGAAALNDPGTEIALATNTSPLSIAPYDITVDTNNAFYVIQYNTSTNDAPYPLIAFPPYEGSPETNATWAVGSGDPTLCEALGVAVDQTATLVAVAVFGTGDTESAGGALDLFRADSGAFVTNLDPVNADRYADVAWDNVGNLYAADSLASVWRVYSPPGPNHATTVAAPFIQQYPSLLPPTLSHPNDCMGQFNFVLKGQPSVIYIIEQSPDLMNWTPVLTNYSTNSIRPVSVPFADSQDFYRALAVP